jgi:hypothetical protein
LKSQRTLCLIGIVVVILISAVHSYGVAAQDTPPGILTVIQQNERIYFYSIPPSGNAKLIGLLPSEFRLGRPTDEAVWFISDIERVAVSRDGADIAFTAQRGQEDALFIYTVGQENLQQVAIQPGLMPLWSPDSSAILLSVCPCKWEEGPYSDRDYVYELTSRQLSPLTEPGSYGQNYHWLTDSSALVYREGNAVLMSSRHGDTMHSLTVLMSPPSPNTYLSICDLTWSGASRRFYYVLGCIGGGEEPYEYIYSVDLNGDHRMETLASLPTFYPDERFVSVVNIHPVPTGNGVYVSLGSEDDSPPLDGLSRWRILRVDRGHIQTIYEGKISEPFMDSVLSPDGQKMLLLTTARGTNGRGFLEVVDLSTRQTLVQSDLNGLGLCNAQWIDNQSILYSADPQRRCDIVAASTLENFWLLDVATGSALNVSLAPT